jgi:MFS family permease
MIPHARTVTSLFFLQIATGAMTALGFPAALGLAAQYGKKFRAMGTMMGLFNGGMSVGLILGPLSGGVLKNIFGLDFVFKGGSLVVAAGFIAFVLLSLRAARRGSAAQLDGTFDARSGETAGLASAASVRSDYSGHVSSKERV